MALYHTASNPETTAPDIVGDDGRKTLLLPACPAVHYRHDSSRNAFWARNGRRETCRITVGDSTRIGFQDHYHRTFHLRIDGWKPALHQTEYLESALSGASMAPTCDSTMTCSHRVFMTPIGTESQKKEATRGAHRLLGFKWAYLDLNQGLLPCEGSTLPLSYTPFRQTSTYQDAVPLTSKFSQSLVPICNF